MTCLAAHPPSERLWAGTSDGRMHCWRVPEGGGGVARWLHSWRAHDGKIKGIAATPWGRVFTGDEGVLQVVMKMGALHDLG